MMIVAITLITIALIGALAALAHWWRGLRNQQLLAKGEITEEEAQQTVNPVDMECCGQHEVCEKDSMLAAISKSIEYYDDEELDRFRGRESDAYNEEETEEFRDVLYTMRSEEVAGWVRSLQLRMINLPEGVRDEVLLIVGERRA